MLDLAKHIVNQRAGDFDPEKFEDHYEEALTELINAKRNGKTVAAKPRPRGENVVDLMDALKKSIANEATGAAPLHSAVMVLLCAELERILGPSQLPKPPKPAKVKTLPKPRRSVTRVPEVERNIALGNELLKLRSKAKWNNEFGRLRGKMFDVDAQTAAELMKVAKLFGKKPDVYRRLSWQALVELSAVSLPWNVRRRLEIAITTGKKVTAVQIRRARLAHAAKRDQPVRMAA